MLPAHNFLFITRNNSAFRNSPTAAGRLCGKILFQHRACIKYLKMNCPHLTRLMNFLFYFINFFWPIKIIMLLLLIKIQIVKYRYFWKVQCYVLCPFNITIHRNYSLIFWSNLCHKTAKLQNADTLTYSYVFHND